MTIATATSLIRTGTSAGLARPLERRAGIRAPVRIVNIECSRPREWDAYVAAHDRSTLFHETVWSELVGWTFGHRARRLMAMRGGRCEGVLPLMEVRSLLAGRLLVSMPYATYGGVLADNEIIAGKLMEAARRMATESRCSSLELRSVDAEDPTLDIQRSHARFLKRLPSTVHDLRASLPRKARAAARRAAECYALTFETNPECVNQVWRLYSRSMRRLASPNYPASLFRNAITVLGQDGCAVHLVRHDGRPVAGLLSFLYRGTVMPYFAGIDERAGIYGLSHFLYLSTMEWGIANGFVGYDFGRTRYDNRGSFDFKRHFGFEPRPLEYQVYVPCGRRAPDLAPSSPRWSSARALWKRLPLMLTRPLGARLARSIPG